jgi:NAD(P)-dependent dehydrogenase (short-subunit alcohol dehydrogenase family)
LVFISSISTKHPYFGGSLYVGSKAALEAYAHTLALELAPNKSRVNLVSPGLVKTKILEETINASGTDGVNEYEKQYPLGFGEPKDIADMIVFLLSEKTKWITGQNIEMEGGLTLGIKK